MWLEFAKFAGLFLALFAVSFFGALTLGRLFRRSVTPPPVNTRIRLRQGSAIFACYLVEANSKAWTLTKPVLQSSASPTKPAGEYLCDFTTDSGLAVFWTRLMEGQASKTPYVRIQAPARILVRERRAFARTKFRVRKPAMVDERPGTFVNDIGQGGAGISSVRALAIGSDVELRMADSPAVLKGVVLDCRPAQLAHAAYLARLRFDREVPIDFVFQLSA
jgi:hypothetical protein